MAATNKNMNFDVNLLPTTTGDHNLGSSNLKWNLYVNDSTISGNLTTQKFIHPVITGSGTAAVTSSPYKPALWKFDLAATPTEGDIITITVPVAGHNNGVFVSTDNGTTYKPVSVSGTGRLTTHYGVGTTISLVYDADGSTASVYPANGADSSQTVSGGCWRVINYYDSGNDTSSIYSFGGSSRSAETSANGGIGLWRYSLQLMTTNRKWSSIAYNTEATGNDSGTTTNKTVSTASFLLNSPILYQDTNTKVSAGSSGNVNGRTAVSFDMRYNTTNAKWSNLTIQMPVFLVGTVNSDGATFKLDTTQWWSQTFPSSNDGKIYILLGYASSASAVYLLTYHPIYYHNGTNVVPYVVNVLDIAHGGTGSTTAANARTNLGLGTMATETAANYLKLSGGTMTGVFTAKASQYDDSITSSTSHAINMNNSNIIGLNAIYTADASDNAAEGINFYRDATHFDTLWVSGGDLLFVPNRALGTNTTKANSQKVGRFTANPTTDQVVITDGTTGGMKSSGYTIATSVPSGAVFTDTKNTAGSTNSTSKLYLIGATSQAANPTTNSYQYTYTNNGLLSALKLGLNLNGTEKAHLEWNDTDQSIDFVFN